MVARIKVRRQPCNCQLSFFSLVCTKTITAGCFYSEEFSCEKGARETEEGESMIVFIKTFVT
jgi:hypothetical protein